MAKKKQEQIEYVELDGFAITIMITALIVVFHLIMTATLIIESVVLGVAAIALMFLLKDQFE